MNTRLRLLTVAPLAAAGMLVTALPAFAAVTEDQAGKIVTDAYGGGNVISVESDSENGVETWEVEVEGSAQGRIEVDVAKDSGELVRCQPEDGQGSCLGAANGGGGAGGAGGDADGTDDGDSGSDSDNGAGAGGGAGGSEGTMPSGGVETGGGATSGAENVGLLTVGGVALVGAATAGGVALRRRAAARG